MQKVRNNSLVVFMFFCFTIGFSILLIKSNALVLTSDSSFHLSRVEEIFDNLKEHHFFTFIAANTFNHTGVGNFLFYPTVFLYPWAFLRFVFNPIMSFYIWYSFFIFLTLIISYYSMRDYSKSTIRSFIFAIIYTICPYHLHLGLYNYVLGEFIAYTFLPLVFLGAYHVFWKDYKKYPLLAIGITLLSYCHILSTYLVCLLLTVLLLGTLVYKHKLETYRLLSLAKSMALSLILSSFIIIPFIKEFIGGSLATPSKGFVWLTEPQQLFETSINNIISINKSVGILVLVTALIGWYFVKNNNFEKCIYALGIFFLAAATTLVPWQMMGHIPTIVNLIGEIQFPYRLNAYSSFFLSITGSLIIFNIIKNTNKKEIKFIILVFFVFATFASYYGSITTIFQRVDATQGNYLVKNKKNVVTLPVNAFVDKNNYTNIFGYLVLNGETDYYHIQPAGKEADYNKTIYTNQIKINNKFIQGSPKVSANRISYSVKVNEKRAKVDLPIISYKGTVIKNNGKIVNSTRSKRGTVLITANKGNNNISVSYDPGHLYFVSIFVSLLGWLLLGASLILKKFNLLRFAK
ncbi:hypothetical protein QS460_06220 [Liquorilactobacillus mali]|uniref:6-pyruvoyl-tetrahydropterin synthase-related protein n=1 Tax=Liquorilactobacillus mali TaxID=1618 RepID=UPI00264AF825|nr:6-pyruvoyl-tetrahydropterin synthase-related protein [Liquorilactobacillus mali]MDN7145521.1 hypothetical protein [Liquorilactobacillus mali]